MLRFSLVPIILLSVLGCTDAYYRGQESCTEAQATARKELSLGCISSIAPGGETEGEDAVTPCFAEARRAIPCSETPGFVWKNWEGIPASPWQPCQAADEEEEEEVCETAL